MMRKLCTFRNALSLMRMMDIASLSRVCKFKSPSPSDRFEDERNKTLFDDDLLKNMMLKEFLMNKKETKNKKKNTCSISFKVWGKLDTIISLIIETTQEIDS